MVEDLALALGERLKGIAADKIVFVGVGNRYRGDDAIGPILIDLLAGKVPHVIDAGSTPENFTGAIKRLEPRAIVFLDALLFKDAKPGDAFVIESGEILTEGSSHMLSIDLVMDYLREDTGAEIFMVGVQPGQISDHEGLSSGMVECLNQIVLIILTTVGSLAW
ncbi:MAG TPA: hydrogenase maturation protease [Methanocella sp.]|nr:hydrogenase maturation protease [Methanocella sp.]